MSRTDLARFPSFASLPPADEDLVDALEAAVPGGVRARAIDRLAVAHDASHYLLTPRALVVAGSTADVAAVLATGAARGVPVTFRSGGTSLSGQASSDGILVDTRQGFRQITVLDSGARVRVQPGATVRAVNARLAPYGTRLGPDPASEAACTIGGVVANNSSGMSCGITHNTYRTLESAVLVLASGTVIDTARSDAETALRDREPELYAGLLKLRDRVRSDPDSQRRITSLYSIKNTMGYGLNSFVDHERAVDILLHLVVGSEGTLAFIAEATFRTVVVKKYLATGLLVFARLKDATSALTDLVAAGLSTIELLDATSLRVAQRDPRADDILTSIDVVEHAALLVEFQEESASALDSRTMAISELLARLPLSHPGSLTSDPDRRAALWHIRKGLYATVAGNRPSGTTALLEDIAVPVRQLGATCEELVELFEAHGYQDSVIFGHAKDGNIHFLLNERFDDEEQLQRYIAFTEDLVELVLRRNGTLKAEHGTGRIMAPYVRRQYGDELYSVMTRVKQLFDPGDILNPGIVLNDDPLSHVSHLKVTPTVEPEVDRCVECGYCEPVCPSKDLTLTPRQRIVLRREIARAELTGDAALAGHLARDFVYDGIETCAVDGMCQTACPVLIDTGDLVRRLRAESATKGQNAAWSLAARHWDAATRTAAKALTAAHHGPSRLVVGGAAAARSVLGEDSIPLWTPDLPAGGSRRLPRPATNPGAVFFAACVGTMFGSASGESAASDALLRLAARAGLELRIPHDIASMCCGTPWKSKGLVAGHDEMSGRVLPALWEASEHGQLPVVCDASSCTEGLQNLVATAANRHPGLRILDSVSFVAEQVLPHLQVTTRLASLALHPTCSSTRLGTTAAMTQIAGLCADEVVIPDDWGCCAFAGDRGMLHPELTASATAAEAASVTQVTHDAYASANRTCEIGLSRATGQPYQHLLEVLEKATRPTTPPLDTTIRP